MSCPTPQDSGVEKKLQYISVVFHRLFVIHTVRINLALNLNPEASQPFVSPSVCVRVDGKQYSCKRQAYIVGHQVITARAPTTNLKSPFSITRMFSDRAQYTGKDLSSKPEAPDSSARVHHQEIVRCTTSMALLQFTPISGGIVRQPARVGSIHVVGAVIDRRLSTVSTRNTRSKSTAARSDRRTITLGECREICLSRATPLLNVKRM